MVVFWEATTSRSLCNSDSIICITGFCANFFTAVFVELSPVCSVCTVGVETFARVVVIGTGELDAVSVVGKEEVGAGGGGGGVEDEDAVATAAASALKNDFSNSLSADGLISFVVVTSSPDVWLGTVGLLAFGLCVRNIFDVVDEFTVWL